MQWISVSDRLPEDGQRVLVWNDGEDWEDDWEEAVCFDGEFYEPSRFNGEQLFDVTHWATVDPPVPHPPDAAGDEGNVTAGASQWMSHGDRQAFVKHRAMSQDKADYIPTIFYNVKEQGGEGKDLVNLVKTFPQSDCRLIIRHAEHLTGIAAWYLVTCLEVNESKNLPGRIYPVLVDTDQDLCYPPLWAMCEHG